MENYQIAILFLLGLSFIIALIAWIFSQNKPVVRHMSLEERISTQKELNNIMNLIIDGVRMSKAGKMIPRKRWHIY